jgi:ubiquinone/menaquinone biosynthesis C-methylase UbiE
MKVRDSGMPNEKMWNAFFNIDLIFTKLELNSQLDSIVEIGCGYGTFTIPLAKITSANIFAFDIELEMIETVNRKAKESNLINIHPINKDILQETTDIPSNSVDYVMLFNILHHDKPNEFLGEAYRILKQRGKVGIIHWRTDIKTPRGPDMSIRPKPEQCVEWAKLGGFTIHKYPQILKPFHYGLIIKK